MTRLGEVLSRRKAFTPETQSQIVALHHAARTEPERGYVAVVKVGSQRFGLVVEELLGSEDVVVKPLHPLLRPLAVYGGATILGDGGVALILSGEGLARHSGMTDRPIRHETAVLPATQDGAENQTLMVFRYGSAESLVLSLGSVRRVVKIPREHIERVGDRELVNIDGTAVNVIRLDRFLNLSPCPEQETLFLVLPRHGSFGFLASEIVDTPTLPLRLDTQAYQADGISARC